MINVALVGAGRMGKTRAEVIRRSKNSQLVAVNDVKCVSLGKQVTLDEILRRKDINAVIVATPTKFHADIAIKALHAGKSVLCEKPMGLNPTEAANMMQAAQGSEQLLHIGFNYRYMAHVQKANDIIENQQLGKLHFMRCRFGHGGRPNYEKEWCTQKNMAGGGALVEQGIHILDLVSHLFGEPCNISVQVDRYFHNFSDTEDNAFCLIDTHNGMAQLHISWTQWKSIFEVEIFGSEGYLRLEGRDGHYGPQRLIFGRRQKDHSRPIETIYEFPDKPTCWDLEWAEFERKIMSGYKWDNAREGWKVQQLVQTAYNSAQSLGNWMPI